MGTILAGVMIYFITPWLSELLNNEVEFVYLFLYSFLIVSSYQESKKIRNKDKK
jgi:hypothetical protein